VSFISAASLVPAVSFVSGWMFWVSVMTALMMNASLRFQRHKCVRDSGASVRRALSFVPAST
jgi:hypothetical protein